MFILFRLGRVVVPFKRNKLSNKLTYRFLFLGFLCSILISFFIIRPLNSPWHRFITGDGFGYYAYLPATFIYQDKHYDYKWFNAAVEKDYQGIGSGSADEHFLVNYKDKKINKYYPGLSLLWLPFFALAHTCALVFQFPANGFSLPYQWGMAFASLFYLFLGLLYLKKFIFKFSGKAWIALAVPILLFYGTPLFDFAINLNSLSHVYSFSVITAFTYYTFRFLNEEENNLYHFCLILLLLALLITIRPLNGLVLMVLPAFVLHKNKIKWNAFLKPGAGHLLLLLLTIGVVVRQFYILKSATGELFPNTYSGEPFYFLRPQLIKAAFGFQYGMFLYAPLLLLALVGFGFYPGKTKRWILPGFFLMIFYIYASWWFWPITNRALIDFYFIPALLLSALLMGLSSYRMYRNMVLGALFLCVAYYQLKQLQFRRGILDANYTHAQLYTKHFFKTHKSQQFAVPPYSIVQQRVFSQGFEEASYEGPKLEEPVYKGNYSTLLDDKNEYTREFGGELSEYFFEKGLPKIRFSVFVFADETVPEFQVYMNFYSKNKTQTLSFPFYVKEDVLLRGQWTELQFGHEFSAEEIALLKDNRVAVYLWNNTRKGRLFIDEANVEVFLCDRSAEIVP